MERSPFALYRKAVVNEQWTVVLLCFSFAILRFAVRALPDFAE
jgi:hypothetical protein